MLRETKLLETHPNVQTSSMIWSLLTLLTLFVWVLLWATIAISENEFNDDPSYNSVLAPVL